MTTQDDMNARTAGAHDDAGHVPVLLRETLDLLAVRPGGRYLDGTVGLGGHSSAIMEAAGGDAELLCLDKDAQALARARERLAPYGDRVRFARTPFSRFAEAMDEIGWERVDGALVDIGVSSLQLDVPERGFSFIADGPLDMRMDISGGAEPASLLVNTASYERLKTIIRDLGEEPMAGRIARAIVQAREEAPIETTLRLAKIVEEAYPAKWRRTARNHPATRAFQALRMAVNDELGELAAFLRDIPERLEIGGRVAVISFHSLEDRMVKHTFREEARDCVCPPRQPLCSCDKVQRLKVLTKKPVIAGDEELSVNPRSRSAKLRAAQRIAGKRGEGA